VIYTTRRGKSVEVLIDECDKHLLLEYSWFVSTHWRTQYLKAPVDRKSNIYLHRLIMGFPDSKVDHINGNGLDNRRMNLRLATDQLNSQNKTRPHIDKVPMLPIGVFLLKSGKYSSVIKVDKKIVRLGVFPTIEEAESAYLKHRAIIGVPLYASPQ
jgi:hypothetical protein